MRAVLKGLVLLTVLLAVIPGAHAASDILATTADDWSSWNTSGTLTQGVASANGYDDNNGFAYFSIEINQQGTASRSTYLDLTNYTYLSLALWMAYTDGDNLNSDKRVELWVNGTKVAERSTALPTDGTPVFLSANISSITGTVQVEIRYAGDAPTTTYMRVGYDYLQGMYGLHTFIVKDELTGDLISGATVRAVNSTSSAENTTGADGETLLPLGGSIYIAQASHTSYYNRTMIIDAGNQNTSTFWLPNTTTDVVFCTFQLYDYTGDFPANSTTLIISKPINNSSRVVYSNYFDTFGRCAAYLVHNDNYQLTIQSNTSMRTLGWFHPTETRTYTLPVGELEVTEAVGLPVAYSFSTDKSGDNTTITVQYETKAGATSYTQLTVYNESWGSIYTATSNATNGSYTYTTNLTSGWVKFYANNSVNDTYAVWWFGTHGAPTTPISELPAWAKNVLSVGIIVFAVLMFAARNVGAGLLLGSGLMGLFIAWGWLEVSELVAASLFVIGALTVIAKSRRRV